jgi:hypothetical protein
LVFGLVSPGSAACPHFSSLAVQASDCDSKLKFTFEVLILNCGFDGVVVHTLLPSGLFVRVELQTRGAANRFAGPAVSRDLF